MIGKSHFGNKNPTKQERTQVYMAKKTHIYRVAGMIGSICGKIPHVYRSIILKQIANHKNRRSFYTKWQSGVMHLF